MKQARKEGWAGLEHVSLTIYIKDPVISMLWKVIVRSPEGSRPEWSCVCGDNSGSCGVNGE